MCFVSYKNNLLSTHWLYLTLKQDKLGVKLREKFCYDLRAVASKKSIFFKKTLRVYKKM